MNLFRNGHTNAPIFRAGARAYHHLAFIASSQCVYYMRLCALALHSGAHVSFEFLVSTPRFPHVWFRRISRVLRAHLLLPAYTLIWMTMEKSRVRSFVSFVRVAVYLKYIANYSSSSPSSNDDFYICVREWFLCGFLIASVFSFWTLWGN